jgi:hypothetical protein
MYFTLKGKSKKGNRTVLFSLKDAPSLLDNNSVILRNVPGSPIILMNSIRRCSNVFTIDGKNIAEGDVLKSDYSKKLYTVVFNNGFRVVDNNNEAMPLRELHAATITGSSTVKDIESIMVFQYGEEIFGIPDILGTKGPYIIINRKHSSFFLLKRVNQLTDMRDCNKKKLALGRIVTLKDGRSGFTQLYRGQITVLVDSEYKDLSTLSGWVINAI